MINVTAKELLQANASIIAGILILLTLLASVNDAMKFGTRLMIGFTITPFIASIFFLLFKKFTFLKYRDRVLTDEQRWHGATISTGLGLAYLIGAVGYFLVGLD